jgi:5-hydroxyisourate hydrolase
MSAITTHILDLALGKPAASVPVELSILRDGSYAALGAGQTDSDGRLRTLLPQGAPLEAGIYRIKFDTSAYFASSGTKSFYPWVEVTFEVTNSTAHYHVPLLLSPYGYSTYRGT